MQITLAGCLFPFKAALDMEHEHSMINHLRRITIIYLSFGERKGCRQCSTPLPVFLRVIVVWNVDRTVRKVIKLSKRQEIHYRSCEASHGGSMVLWTLKLNRLEFKSWLHWWALTGPWGIYSTSLSFGFLIFKVIICI